MPYLSFAAICLLFGSNFILMSEAKMALGPMVIGLGRVIGAAAVLVPLWWMRSSREVVPRHRWPALAWVALLATAYPYAIQPLLIARAHNHSFFGALVSLTPLATIAVSIPMLGVWPSSRQLLGVLGGFGFLALLVFDGIDRSMEWWVLLLGVSIPCCYATANTYLKRTLADLPSLSVTSGMMVMSAAMLVPFAAAEPKMPWPRPEHPEQWVASLAAVAVLGVLGTGVTMWLFVGLVQQHGPLFAGMTTYVVPLVAVLWGAFDREKITLYQMVSIFGVLSMVALVQYGMVGATQRLEQTGDLSERLPRVR
ncbi:EamA-like transporter family protein [Pirellulimonas nuda]|uniref:EamA-like transporter family protein n=1 Tax=Pirellulimonas nuda TaxID=2528009 RepID=A0A518DA25_9BACT|nr:DMT family transporter [Pirellulimonas nuda]QDU88335.1 EamA-like transporter family protein [Pirellulimonas nuda]